MKRIVIGSQELIIWSLLHLVIPLVPIYFYVFYATQIQKGKFDEALLIPSLLLFAFSLVVGGFYVVIVSA